MARAHPWVLLLLLVALVRPSQGAASGISLRLQKVTASEAILALQRVSGIALELRTLHWPEGESRWRRNLEERVTFSWRNASVGEALRDVARRYGLVCYPRQGGGFVLWDSIARSMPPYAGTPSAQAGPLRLEVQQVRLAAVRPSSEPGDVVYLQLLVRSLPGPWRAAPEVVGLDNVVARDDRGGVLLPEARGVRPPFAALQRTFPDEWVTTVRLTGLQPGATRLSLQGDLLFHTSTETQRCEVPLPLPTEGVERRMRNLRVKVQELGSGPPRLPFPNEREGSGRVLRTRIGHPPDAELFAPNGLRGGEPVLVGASGRTYAPTGVHPYGQSEFGAAGFRLGEWVTQYPVIDEPLTAVRLELAEQRGPFLAGAVRIAGIPIPGVGNGDAGTVFPNALPAGPLGAESPDFQSGGGTLSTVVRIAGRPAAPGRLTVGLLPVVGESTRRWYEAEVGPGGAAVLKGLRPGDYHVLRSYRPRDWSAEIPNGWWRNAESRIRVEAGREAALTPLEFTEGAPPPRPAQLDLPEEPNETKVEGLSLDLGRTLELFRKPETRYEGALSLILRGMVGGVESRRLYGVRRLTACDDRGNLLTWRYGQPVVPIEGEPFQGLGWRQVVSLSPPHPLARSLAWVEGELQAYGQVESTQVELPVPPPAGARWERGPLSIELVSLQSRALPVPPGAPRAWEYLLQVRAEGPDGTEFVPRLTNRHPVLVGRSGNTYSSTARRDTNLNGRWDTWCRYEASEPVEKVRLDLSIRTDLEPVLTFRLRNVPLPEDRAFKPAIRPVPLRNVLRPPAARPQPRLSNGFDGIDLPMFHEEGGAELLLLVRQGERSVPDGTLHLGFSRKTPAGWTAPRWTEVRVLDSSARLEAIKPGVYRITASYRANRAVGAGKARLIEALVTLSAGKQTVTPLRFPAAP